jgi:hypothetical protein
MVLTAPSQNLTFYPQLTLIIEDMINNPTDGPYLTVLASTLLLA